MRTITLVIVILATTLPQGAPADDRLPPGHPPVTTRPATPPLPAGHPPLPVATTPQPAEPDLTGIHGTVSAYYAAISGPAGAARDWNSFESLFRPDARLVTVTPGNGGDRIMELTPAQFVATNRAYFERGGFFEASISDRVVTFGRVAHVWSTYESRRSPEAAPYSRGINSFQLVSADGRWWITGVAWDRERLGAPIPAEYLPVVEAR